MAIPIFDAVIENSQDGIYALSLVEYPATEVQWQTFSKDEKKRFEKFEVANEEKHNFICPIMVADTPIYRYDENFGEYYLRFSKETCEKMARNLLRSGAQNNFDTEHSEVYLDFGSVETQEVFLKDVDKGINPVGFEEVPNGSLMGIFHVNSIDIWQDIKAGKYKGISLAGWFDYKEAFSKTANQDEQEVLDLLNKIENKLKNKKE